MLHCALAMMFLSGESTGFNSKKKKASILYKVLNNYTTIMF